MSIRKNTFDLDSHYDLTKSGQNGYFANERIIFAWGANTYGNLGQNTTTNVSSPVQIPGTSWSVISGGWQHNLLLKTDGTLFVTGGNGNGQLGLNNITQFSSPVQIPGTTWSSISGAYFNSSAIKTDGTLWSWGYNRKGQLGQNNTTRFSSPVQIPGTSWSAISAGASASGSESHSLAIQSVSS